MASGTFNILAGADDGYVNDFPQFVDTANYGYMGEGSGYSYSSWFRFDNVTIESGSTITLAKITFIASNPDTGTVCNLNIYFEDAADPDAPTSQPDYEGKSLGSPVAWSAVPAWTQGNSYDTPELKTILQAVIDLSGWNSGQAVQCLIKDNLSDSGAHRWAASYENGSYTEAQLYVEWDPPATGDSEDSFTISDQVDVIETSEVEVASSEVQDSVDVEGEFPRSISDDMTVSDFTDAGFLHEGSISDDLSIADQVDGIREISSEQSDSFTIDDSADAFLWSEWLRENYGKYVIRYYLTLTGDADGLSDLELKYASFQATKRNGDPTYLSAVVPSFIQISAINARSNGDLKVDMAYLIDGEESFRENILWVDLETIRTDEGPKRRSITLSGSRTYSYGSNQVALDNPIYKYVSDGKIKYRFLHADPWLNPGDVAQCRTDEFVVAFVTYTISDRFKQMEVSET